MACSLPQDWAVILVMAHSMRDFVFEELADLLISGRLRVWELSNSTRALHHICPNFETHAWCTESTVAAPEATPWSTTWDLGNEIFLFEPLFLATPTSRLIVFQTDGLLCRPLTKTDISTLLPYDYIGAPWTHHREEVGGGTGGNGGFSFRNRDTHLRVLEAHRARGEGPAQQNEDHFFSERVTDAGGRLPPLELATNFAVETLFRDRPLGFHKPWKFLAASELARLFDGCPVIEEVRRVAETGKFAVPKSCT
jgi:hypothetical protein